MFRLFTLSSIAVIAALLAQPASAASISFLPQDQIIGLSDTTTVDVQFSEPAGVEVAGYDITISWDPTVVELTDVAFDWRASSSVRSITYGLGEVRVRNMNAGGNLVTERDLFSLTFDGIGAGTSPLNFDRAYGAQIVSEEFEYFSHSLIGVTFDSSVDYSEAELIGVAHGLTIQGQSGNTYTFVTTSGLSDAIVDDLNSDPSVVRAYVEYGWFDERTMVDVRRGLQISPSTPGSITVTPSIPEPASTILFGVGALLMGKATRKRSQRRS